MRDERAGCAGDDDGCEGDREEADVGREFCETIECKLRATWDGLGRIYAVADVGSGT